MDEFSGFQRPTYTQLPDELIDNLLPYLTGAETKVVLYIARQTFGYGKASDQISLTQLSKGTGLNRETVVIAVKRLEECHVIRVIRGAINRYALNLSADIPVDQLPSTWKIDQVVGKSDRSEKPTGRKIEPEIVGFSDHQVVGKSDTQEIRDKRQKTDIAASAAPPPKTVRPSKQKPAVKQTTAKPKNIIAPPDGVAAERRAMFGEVVKAVIGVEHDDPRAKPFVTANRGRINKMVENFHNGGATAATLRADYGAGGRWYTLPCYMALDTRDRPTNRPSLDWIQKTFGNLDNHVSRFNGKGQPRAPASPTDPAAALREAEERATARRTASPFLTADLPPVWANQGDP